MSSIRSLSVRTRLAFQFAVAVGVLVLLYGGGVYLVTRSAMLEQLAARLHEDFEAAEHGFEAGPDGSPRWLAVLALDDDPGEAPWAEIADAAGQVLLRRPEAASGADPDAAVYQRDYAKGSTTYTIRVGRSRGPVERALADLLWLLAASLVPAVLLAFFVGRWFAARALAPVAAMTEQARAISAERLSERLPVANPGDELGRLASVFNDTFARLEQAFERLKRFTADASHELRTPLTAMRSVGEVGLREGRSPEALREVIGSMLEETERLTKLVEGLLTLSRGEAQAIPDRADMVSLVDIAYDVKDRLAILGEERCVRIEVWERSPAYVFADAALLRQALTNLVDNALKHAPDGSRVYVEVGSDPVQNWIDVVDEGPGIAPEHQAHVFERFYRVDPARSGTGAGLGLAIARWAVEAQGGRIELRSTPGAGCSFRISLPHSPTAAGRGSPGA